MAATMVLESFLSASFTVVMEKLASPQVLNFFRHRRPDDRLLRKLELQLISVNRLLVDAEEKQITDREVKKWLNNLKHAVYEAEDFLDELGAEMAAAAQASTSQLVNMIGFLDPRQNKEEEMASKLKELVQTFEDILEAKDALGLTPGNQERTPTLLNRQTTSLVDDSTVFGRNGDKEAIVKLLLSDDAGNTCPGVISVVGMGGIGKTTVAQLVFNDRRVKERFDKLKVWVCVSEEVDVIKLTKNILKEIGSSHCDSMTPNQLQLELQEKVKGQGILLVMDDVWNNIDWELLLKPLKSVARGSKVLVTTREERVLSKVKGVSGHQLKVLSEEDCWSLFANHAFDDDSSEADANLKELGTKIIRKCKCLPLAVKTIGSLLYSERRAREWEKILESNIWDLDDGIIIPALKLSYHYLPSHLKQCFVYCAMFPKDFEFKKKELILLWIAEGFIVQNNIERRELEEVGEKYFEDLCSRSFFQEFKRYDGLLCFVMHDLLNDLAKSIAVEFCYNNIEANSGKLTEKTRHVFYKGGYGCNILEELENISKAECLRTLICSMKKAECRHAVDLLPRFRRLRVFHLCGRSSYKEEDGINISHLDSSVKHLRYLKLDRLPILNIPETMPYLQRLIIEECQNLTSLPDSIGDMKDLRHLSLRETGIKLLPDSIGNLKDLRHLDLGFNKHIERLPESVSGLHSLQHLSLHGCEQLVELPTKMSNLVNLCHLDISDTKLKSMPPQMGKLIKLQTLSDFIVDKGEGSCIAELRHFRNLKGSFCLENLQNVRDEQDALKAKIKDKSRLKILEYVWEDDDNNSDNVDRSLLQHLEPHVNIRRIDIKGYRGIDFPKWVGDSSFSNIVALSLYNCKYCTRLPLLGQLASLKNLSIMGFDSLVSVGAEVYGSSNSIQPFRSLKWLYFDNMPKLKQWSCYENETEEDDFTDFPLLQHLSISNCPELEMAMRQGIFPSTLKMLKIAGCNKITSGHQHRDLHKFSSLSWFTINSIEDIESFPDMILLPSTLRCIWIVHLPNLKSLDYKGLHHLTSLTKLEISLCPNLECIPDEGLPESLTQLCIHYCPLLKKKCRKEQGEDWPKIARIQKIVIDNKKIQS